MTPAELKFWLLAQRRTSRLQPDIAAALLRAIQIIRDSLTEAELERLVASGQFEAVLNELLSDAVMDRAFIAYRLRLREATQSGFRYAIPSLPGGGKIAGTLAVMFDHLSPHVITAIDTLESKVIHALQQDIREAVRTAVREALIAGKSSSAAAKVIRPTLGMSPTQAENAAKYEAKLIEQGKSAEQIDAAVARYRKRAIALNAETNAGTAVKDAYKRGQQLAWQSAVDNGTVDPSRLRKQWIGVMDDRERPEHVAMEKEVQPYDQPYSNGEIVPGESTYNCRCVSRFFVAAA